MLPSVLQQNSDSRRVGTVIHCEWQTKNAPKEFISSFPGSNPEFATPSTGGNDVVGL